MTERERSHQFDPVGATCTGGWSVLVRELPAQVRGGDIYDVIQTKFGLRVLIGDVMGTGIPASQTGAEILAGWRAIARTEPTLAGAAVRLHGLVTKSEHPERFVTALMANFDSQSWAEFVCCGHPPPLLLTAGTATFVDTYEPAPPLGLLDMADGWCSPGTFRFTGADRLLLYTDGVSEARDDARDFFPLASSAAAAHRASGGDGDALLDGLLARLRTHAVDRPMRDDVLLMLVSPVL
ncbi:MAG: PP2C family protein-serine/threonine phosphatase [Streptosporangiaceae bacterium]|jgi:serine phosphatase RsbU (regulator of sigma subunit)